MPMFTFAISSLTPSNLPWSMGLTFQVPMRYCFFRASDFTFTTDTSTIECHFCFGPVTSFFLELLAPLSPVACWDTLQPGLGWGVVAHVSLPFHTGTGVLGARILEWVATSSPSGPHFVRALYYDLLSWVALHGMTYSFIELSRSFSTRRIWPMKNSTRNSKKENWHEGRRNL